MNFKEEFKNLDKKSLLCLGAIILVTVLVFVGLSYFLSKDIEMEIEDRAEELRRRKTIEKQMGELDGLMEGASPLTEQEIQGQVDDLKEAQEYSKPSSEKEIQKQIEELHK